MTDLDRALARLQDPCRPEIADDVAVVVGEIERLREALNSAHMDLPWCECRSNSDDQCEAALALGGSPVPVEPTADESGSRDVDEILRWVRAARPTQVYDPKHEAWMLATKQDRGSIEHWIKLGGSFRLAPSHPTGEERDR